MLPVTKTGKHILVVNDEPAILGLFQELLGEQGYKVSLDKFERPMEDLLERVKTLRPDLAILDFIIGGEDKGWQLLQVLRMDRATQEIPIIVCTAAVRQVTELSAHLNEQGIQVVLKPFDIDHLLKLVSAAWALKPGGDVSPDVLGIDVIG